MSIWKASADEKRAIRAVAAASENRDPQSIIIEVGERISILEEHAHLPMSERISTNLLTFGPDDDGIERSDLHQPVEWTELDRGIELVDGKAIVDFYVYEKMIGDHGDLLTNVQAHVETVNGKPMLYKITGTGMPDVSGDTLHAFTVPSKYSNHPGTQAYYDIKAWKARYRGIWADAR